MGINIGVEDIVRQELEQGYPLLDAGWQMETPVLCSHSTLSPRPSRPSTGQNILIAMTAVLWCEMS